jgi:ribonuclease HI
VSPLLAGLCTVICQHDVIKYMLQETILSSRVGKWAFALVEYDLEYKPLKAMKGQIIADFIVDHSLEVNDVVGLVETDAWMLHFDGSVCSHGQGVRCFIISPNGVEYELAIRLEFRCTNNQTEYEALLIGLETLVEMGAREVEAFGDSKLVVQQINEESQCLDGLLNEYLYSTDTYPKSIRKNRDNSDTRADTYQTILTHYWIRNGPLAAQLT